MVIPTLFIMQKFALQGTTGVQQIVSFPSTFLEGTLRVLLWETNMTRLGIKGGYFKGSALVTNFWSHKGTYFAHYFFLTLEFIYSQKPIIHHTTCFGQHKAYIITPYLIKTGLYKII